MRRRDGFVHQQIGDEHLLVPTGVLVRELNGIVTLNETGAFIWSLLETDCTMTALADAVAANFQVDAKAALVDVEAFVAGMGELGLLEA